MIDLSYGHLDLFFYLIDYQKTPSELNGGVLQHSPLYLDWTLDFCDLDWKRARKCSGPSVEKARR